MKQDGFANLKGILRLENISAKSPLFLLLRIRDGQGSSCVNVNVTFCLNIGVKEIQKGMDFYTDYIYTEYSGPISIFDLHSISLVLRLT